MMAGLAGRKACWIPARIATATLQVDQPAVHVVRIFGTDPGVMLEKLVIDCGGLSPTYLGPAETARIE